MPSFRTMKVKTRVVPLYGYDGVSQDTRESIKGNHAVAFVNREKF